MSVRPFVHLQPTINIHSRESFEIQLVNRELLEANPFETLTPKLRLVFDFDLKDSDVPCEITRLKYHKEISDRLADLSASGWEFVATDGFSKNKVSFHVIFYNEYIEREHFKKEFEQKRLADMFGMIPDFMNYIDQSIYGKHVCLRVPYGVSSWTDKKGKITEKLNPHMPMTFGHPLDLTKFLVTYIPKECKLLTYNIPVPPKAPANLRQTTDGVERKNKIQTLLDKINRHRFNNNGDRSDWLRLITLFKSNDFTFEEYYTYLRDSGYTKYDKNAHLDDWETTKTDRACGFPTLYKWCEADGVHVERPQKSTSELVNLLMQDYNYHNCFTDYNVCKVLKQTYNDNLYFTNSHGWLHYNGSKWVIGNKTIIFFPLMKFLTEDLLVYYKNRSFPLSEQYNKVSNDIKKEDNDIKIAELKLEHKKINAEMKVLGMLLKDINNLQSASKIDSILKVAEGYFEDPNILDTFDMKPHWFCFDNQKAYDLKTKQIVDIKATDRILTTCGYNMPERNEENIKLIEDVLCEIMPKEDYESFLSSMALFVYGENINEAFIVWKGVGRNGKGLTHDALKTVLGNYFVTLPEDQLTSTESKNSGRACSELAMARFARCLMTSEPDERQMINKTKINLLTGRDPITTRFLQKNAFTFIPKFTLGMMCNDIPKVSGGISTAIANRMKIQEFPYQFITDPDPTIPHQKPLDVNKKNLVKTDSYRDGLLYLLFDTWHKNNGLYKQSESSKHEQEEYKKMNNPLTPFLSQYETSDKPETELNVMRNAFIELYGNSVNGATLTSFKFRVFLEQAGIKLKIDKSNGNSVYLKKILK